MKSLISKRIVSAGAIATLALLAACGDDSSSSATPDDQNSSSSEEISSSSAKESSSKDKSSSSVAKSSDSKIESSSESAESSESKEMISCYMYIVDADDADDIEESCMETPMSRAFCAARVWASNALRYTASASGMAFTVSGKTKSPSAIARTTGGTSSETMRWRVKWVTQARETRFTRKV